MSAQNEERVVVDPHLYGLKTNDFWHSFQMLPGYKMNSEVDNPEPPQSSENDQPEKKKQTVPKGRQIMEAIRRPTRAELEKNRDVVLRDPEDNLLLMYPWVDGYSLSNRNWGMYRLNFRHCHSVIG